MHGQAGEHLGSEDMANLACAQRGCRLSFGAGTRAELSSIPHNAPQAPGTAPAVGRAPSAASKEAGKAGEPPGAVPSGRRTAGRQPGLRKNKDLLLEPGKGGGESTASCGTRCAGRRQSPQRGAPGVSTLEGRRRGLEPHMGCLRFPRDPVACAGKPAAARSLLLPAQAHTMLPSVPGQQRPLSHGAQLKRSSITCTPSSPHGVQSQALQQAPHSLRPSPFSAGDGAQALLQQGSAPPNQPQHPTRRGKAWLWPLNASGKHQGF